MLASPSIALDLPLKILVREDEHGQTRIAYNDPQFLAERYGLGAELVGNISVVAALAGQAAG